MNHFSTTSTLVMIIFICPNFLRMVNAGDKDKGHTIIVKSGDNDRYHHPHPYIVPVPVPVPIHHHGHHGHYFARRSGQINPSSSVNSNSYSNAEASESTPNYTPSPPYVTPFGAGLPFPLASLLSQSMMSPSSFMSPSSIYQLLFGAAAASPHITHRIDTSGSNVGDAFNVDGKGGGINNIVENENSGKNSDANNDMILPGKSSLNLAPGILHPVFTPDYSSVVTSSVSSSPSSPLNPNNNGFMWKFTPIPDSADYWTR